MSGELLWRLVRLYEASRNEPTDRQWASAWFKGSPPDVSVNVGLEEPALVRPKNTERQLDPSTMTKEDEEGVTNDVWATSAWTPRFLAWNASLQPAENRIAAVHLVMVELARLIQATELRFKVLNLWNDPKKLSLERDGRDTSESALAALLDLFKGGGAPSATPLAADTDRLASDRRVQTRDRAKALEVELFKPVITNREALEYAADWAGSRLFDEKLPIDPWKAGQENSAKARERSLQADDLYRSLALRINSGLAQDIWRIERDGLEVVIQLERAIISASTDSLLGLDEQLLAELTVGAHATLRSLDTIEPIVRDISTAPVLEGALARVRIASEQRAAQATLSKLRGLLTVALAAWDTRTLVAIEVAFASQRNRLSEAAGEEVPSAQSKWKEQHTKRPFEAWTAALARVPAIKARVDAYRELASTLSKVSVATSEEPEEASTTLAAPRDAILKRGKRLFEALVEARDLLLPTVGKPEERSRLIALVDALMGAHLAWVAEQPTVVNEWFVSWQGKLSVPQINALVDSANGGSIQGWFRAAAIAWRVDLDGLVWERIPSGKARPRSYGEGASAKRIVQWADPTTRGWSYWITNQPADTLDHDMREGVSPRDPELEGALDTSFRNDEVRAILSEWIAARYIPTGGIPAVPIDRVAVMEVARAFYQYLWPIIDKDLRKLWNKVEKMKDKLNRAETSSAPFKLSKFDKQLDKNLATLSDNLFGKRP